jgi:hypothetical protein
MTQKAQKLVAESTNIIELVGLRDQVTGDYVEDATVIVALLDHAGDPVTGAEAVTMEHVSGTTGSRTTYRGTLSHELALVVGPSYMARVVATASDDSVRTFPVPASVVALP